MDDLLKHPECRSASADQAFSNYVWDMQVSDVKNILVGLSPDAEAKRLDNELEDIMAQAIDLMILNSQEISD